MNETPAKSTVTVQSAVQASNLTEEQIIKKRLLNDESSIRKATGSILKFLNLSAQGDSDKDLVEQTYNQILEEIADLEYYHLKNQIKLLNIKKDHDYYKKQQEEKVQKNQEITEEIGMLENELSLITKKKNIKLKFNQLGNHVVALDTQDVLEDEILLKKRAYEDINHQYEKQMKKLEGKERKLEFVLSSLKGFLIEEED